jgi:amidase
LGVMTGIDSADAATQKSEGKFSIDYAGHLNPKALTGARIGIARDFMGVDADVNWVVTTAIEAMRRAGATIVDVRFPKWLLEAKGEFYNAIRQPEFPVQIAAYLATLGPKYPKNIQEMIERADRFTGTRADGARPNASRWAMFKTEAASGTLDDYRYKSVRDFGLPMVRAAVEGMLASQQLDAIVYPTSPRKPALIAATQDAGAAGVGSATNIANLTGFPDLIVPAGFTGDALPVGISFFGPAFSEQKLLSLGYSFEQATHARSRPVNTPPLKGGSISLP